jgi:hypothetical protein
MLYLERVVVAVLDPILLEVVLGVQEFLYSNTQQHNQQEQYSTLQAHLLHNLLQ